jgi:uncharacterized protein (DUF736 family)
MEKAMTYEEKDGDFVLFRNNKRKSDKSPHYTGTINKDGVKYNFSMWEKTSKNGNPFFSGKIGEVYVPLKSNALAERERSRVQPTSKTLDDDVPW